MYTTGLATTAILSDIQGSTVIEENKLHNQL
jgi:hypothetical protein